MAEVKDLLVTLEILKNVHDHDTQEINKKADKVDGKGLSTNDYTNAAKQKVDAIPANPKYTDTVYDDTALKQDVAKKVQKASDSTVAFQLGYDGGGLYVVTE